MLDFSCTQGENAMSKAYNLRIEKLTRDTSKSSSFVPSTNIS